MLALDMLAERKIAEAIAQGEMNGLPGEGRPLDLDDDALVPEDLRMAYRILKNAGYAPAEVGVRAEIAELERLVLGQDGDEASRARAVRRLALLRISVEACYREKLSRRFAR